MTVLKFAVWTALGLVGLGLALWALTHGLAARIEARFPPVGRFETVDGLNLHLIDVPAGPGPVLPPILFLHGASGNARDLAGALLEPLRGKARLIFVDRPGAGWSERGEAMAAPEAQARVLAALLDRLGIARAVVVGHSLGGAVAAAFAVTQPAKTAGLAFIAPATHPWPGGTVNWYYNSARRDWSNRLFSETLATPFGQLLYSGAIASVFAPNTPPADYPERSGTQLVLRPTSFRANAQDVAQLYDNVTRLAPRYREITAPTVIVTGDRDGVVRPDIHSEGLARDIAGARLIWLKGAGHMPPYSHTAEVVDAILSLADRVTVPAAPMAATGTGQSTAAPVLER